MWKLVGMMFVVLGASIRPLPAQTVVQLTEQLVLDYQKLSQLKSILQQMYDEYKIIDKGLSDVKDIVNGNFNLHEAFLDGLLAVSPAVRNYSRVADIISAEYTMVIEYQSGFGAFKSSGAFTPDEVTYIGKVYTALINRSVEYITQLTKLLTDNQLRMGDADRLSGIDRIYGGISRDLGFLRRMNSSNSLQQLQRVKEAADLNVLNSFF